jgi:CheY-like chemotaxis protein
MGLSRTPDSGVATAVGVMFLSSPQNCVHNAEHLFIILADRKMPRGNGQEQCSILRTYIQFVVHIQHLLP